MQIRQLVLQDRIPAADDLRAALDISPQLLLVFASVGFLRDPKLYETLREAFPGAAPVGCSTAGEISNKGVDSGSCVVTAVHFEHAAVTVTEARVATLADSHAGGAALAVGLERTGLRAVLLFGRGVDINGSALIDGLVSGIGADVPITGGLAGDDGAFTETWVMGPSGVSTTGVVAIGLYGDGLILSHGSYGGWEPYGPARKVTRCDGNLLYELDGEPALNLYKAYLGDYASGLPASGLLFPFEMLGHDHAKLGLIRTILGINEADGSLILAGEIDPDGYLRLMHASTDSLTDGAAHAAHTAADHYSGQIGLALLVSCVGRKLVMGDLVEDEIDVVVEAIGKTATITGFYSYGEISPFSNTTDCKLHNQTMTVTFLGEA